MKTIIINEHRDPVPENAVYIGRPSKWGNPFIIGVHGNRKQVIEKYKAYILSKPQLLASLHELRGKTLVCYCKLKPCHGDVLINLINQLKE